MECADVIHMVMKSRRAWQNVVKMILMGLTRTLEEAKRIVGSRRCSVVAVRGSYSHGCSTSFPIRPAVVTTLVSPHLAALHFALTSLLPCLLTLAFRISSPPALSISSPQPISFALLAPQQCTLHCQTARRLNCRMRVMCIG